MDGPQQHLLVFVSRRDAKTRCLSRRQEERLLHLLRDALSEAKSDWAIAVYSDLNLPPVTEAVRLFALASIVVGVHGAALSNVLFCRGGASLVEVTMRRAFGFPLGFRDYAHLAAAIGLRYWAVPLELDYSARVELPVPLLVRTAVLAAREMARQAE